jgi:hypothetical protein
MPDALPPRPGLFAAATDNIVQHWRTATANNPPAPGSLRDGQLALEQNDPVRLWMGVPTSIDPSGMRVLFDAAATGGAPIDGFAYGKLNNLWARVLPLTGGTLTGALVLAGNATAALNPVSLQQMNAAIAAIPAGVVSWNTRKGDVVLQQLDVSAVAVGSFNGRIGAVTLQVADVTGLGFITSATSDARYVDVAGDTMTGPLQVSSTIVSTSTIKAGIGVGSAQLNPGDATNPGYLALYNPAGTRVGYVGWQVGGPRLQLQSENGYIGWSVNGDLQVSSNIGTTATITGGYIHSTGSIQADGDSNASGNMLAGRIRATNSIMNDTGAFYVANNANYYLARGQSTGRWSFVENGTENFGIDTSGNIWSRAAWTGTYAHATGSMDNDGQYRGDTLIVRSGLGIQYSAFTGYWIAYGWNGYVNVYVNGGYQGDLWMVGQNDGRYKAIGAYTPNQNVDAGAGPNFSWVYSSGDFGGHNCYIDGTLGLNFRGVYNSGVWYAFGWDGHLHIAINGGGQGPLAFVADVNARYSPNMNVDYHSNPTFWQVVSDSSGAAFNAPAGYGVSAGGWIGPGSDARWKKDVRSISPEAARAWVQQGHWCRFTMEIGDVSYEMAGVIAQEEIAAGRADLVRWVDSDDPRVAQGDAHSPAGKAAYYNYNDHIAFLTVALRDALDRIEALEARQ